MKVAWVVGLRVCKLAESGVCPFTVSMSLDENCWDGEPAWVSGETDEAETMYNYVIFEYWFGWQFS